MPDGATLEKRPQLLPDLSGLAPLAFGVFNVSHQPSSEVVRNVGSQIRRRLPSAVQRVLFLLVSVALAIVKNGKQHDRWAWCSVDDEGRIVCRVNHGALSVLCCS